MVHPLADERDPDFEAWLERVEWITEREIEERKMVLEDRDRDLDWESLAEHVEAGQYDDNDLWPGQDPDYWLPQEFEPYFEPLRTSPLTTRIHLNFPGGSIPAPLLALLVDSPEND